MFESNELRVKPVRRYRVPRYPSHTDPDPTQFPYPVPYPVSRKFAAAIASVGLAATTSCSNSDSPTPAVGAQPLQVTSTAAPGNPGVENPFTAEISGLPHRTSPYGTGVPNYIDEELARRVIERTFRDAGYRLKANHPINDSGVACVANGYDERRKVGYVFAGWKSLEGDALIRWWAPVGKPGDTAGAIAALLEWSRYDDDIKELAAEVEAARALPDPARREAALQAILEKRGRERLSMAEIEKLQEQAPRTKRFIAVISQFDTRFAQGGWDSFTAEELAAQQRQREEIAGIPDPAKRDAALRELEEKAARAVIERLEKCVREYIEWARSQGGA